MFFIKGSRLAKFLKVRGIVLWPFLFFSDQDPSNEIMEHELVHVDQIRRLGPWRFYFAYIREYLKHRRTGLDHHEAYMSISFEIEAYGKNKKLS